MAIILQDDAADTLTREWLMNVMSNQRQGSIMSGRNPRKYSASDKRRRSSVMGSPARLISVRQTHDRDSSSDDEVMNFFLTSFPRCRSCVDTLHGAFDFENGVSSKEEHLGMTEVY